MTHLLAAALRASGAEPLTVSAFFRPSGAAVDLHDVLIVDLGSALASFASTCAYPYGHPPTWELRYVGERGTVVHDLASGSATVTTGHDRLEIAALPDDQRYPSRAVVGRFIDTVLGGATNPAPGRLGAEVVALLEAAHGSADRDGAPHVVPRPTRSPI